MKLLAEDTEGPVDVPAVVEVGITGGAIKIAC